MKYLTGADLERHDCVDNSIYNLICELAKGKEVFWDMEDIGEVRDVIQDIIVNKLNLMTEMEFYPFIEEEEEDGGLAIYMEPVFDTDEIIVTEEQLLVGINGAIDSLDADDLAKLAGDAIGGVCWYTNDGLYSFIPDENYCGGLDFAKCN